MTINRNTGKAMNQQLTDKHELETYENVQFQYSEYAD